MEGSGMAYEIDTDSILFGKGEEFDITDIGARQTPWWNRTLCEVNQSWGPLGCDGRRLPLA